MVAWPLGAQRREMDEVRPDFSRGESGLRAAGGFRKNVAGATCTSGTGRYHPGPMSAQIMLTNGLCLLAKVFGVAETLCVCP